MYDFHDPELLRRIPLSAQIVLEVGGGDGGLVEAYRLLNPKARILGFVPQDTLTPLHEDAYDRLEIGDVESAALPFHDAAGRIDCIIYDQCLEHMRDPMTLLHRHTEALSLDGMMLIKVANPDYWRLTERMLRGAPGGEDIEPPPVPPPLFGPSRLRDALLGLGLVLCDVTVEDQSNGDAAEFVAAMAPALAALGVAAEDYAERATPSHYIWRVRRTQGERLVLRGNMLAPVGGVSHVRVVHPLAAIGSDPLAEVALIETFATAPPADGLPRIFVLHRPALTFSHGAGLLRGLRSAGYLIVTEFDDHPDYFHMMRQGGELTFRGVHALQTSTPALAQVLRRYNPEIAIFPNALATLPQVRNFADPQKMTLFFGALNREACWAPLMEVINAVAHMAGPRLNFQVVHDRQFFEALETPHKAFTPTCDYDTYLQLLGSSEICFMPLSDTPFNRAKSDLKFVECGACRVASLASSVVYGESIRHGETGFLFRDQTELYQSLMRLLEAPDTVRALGDAARRYVISDRMLAYQVAPRLAWYRSLWQRRAELTAALDARVGGALAHAA